MKVITRMELEPGMILGDDVVDQGKVLYASGTKVDQVMIDRLNRYSILCVTIMENIDFATTHYERIRCDENFIAFEKKYTYCLNYYKSIMKNFLENGKKTADRIFLGLYKELYAYISSGSVLLDYLYNMVPDENELTYTHCLNSALLAGTFADWLCLNEEEKNTLILCGFYYDIGKLSLPYNILWKPDKLTKEEFEMVKSHPAVGHKMVSTCDLDQHVKKAILMHHERQDGSGYPYQFEGDMIDTYARYIAIIDTYIAMASPRTYRSAFTPLQILDTFEKSLEKYDTTILLKLMKHIADAQIGTMVQLNDDSVWEVFIIPDHEYARPILKNDNNGILDLLEHPELHIVKNV